MSMQTIRRVAKQVTSKSGRHDNRIALENIEGHTGRLIATDSEYDGEGISFQKGDVLYGKLRPYLAKVHLASQAGEAIGDFYVVRPEEIDGRYLSYLLISPDVTEAARNAGYGAKMPRVSWEFVSSVPVPVSERSGQIAIAAFLDQETGRIDDLIAEQEHLIMLLDETRQAVISHAVTKGLHPNVEMKDSGNKWLGEVPAHWEVVPLKHVATSNDEALPENTLPEHEIRYIEISDVDSIEGIRSANAYEFHAAPSRARRIVREGDVLASTVRTYLRAIAPVSQDYAGCIASTGFCVIRAHRCFAHFLGYAIRSEAFISDVISNSTGVSYPAINSTDLMCLKIAVPAPDEQEEIATYLDKATRKFDALSKEARSGISLLKERRSALISAAVTGKIDVRNHPAAVAALNKNKD